MPRIYVDVELIPGAECELPPAAAHHVRDVLRLGIHAELVLFNGRGGEYSARLLAATRAGARALVEAHHLGMVESPLTLTLVQSISRGERMDYTLQKAVELGVNHIVPVVSRRTVVRLDTTREEKRLEHWCGVVRHATEQCGRAMLPTIAAVVPLASWLAGPRPSRCYLLDPRAPTSLAAAPDPPYEVAIVAGPEGGFDPQERADLLAAGVVGVRLGPRILRTETAALTALTVLQTRWGDLA